MNDIVGQTTIAEYIKEEPAELHNIPIMDEDEVLEMGEEFRLEDFQVVRR